MSAETLDCYILPGSPNAVLLPVECVAEVVAEPIIEALESAPAEWMQGHVNWRNQRLPVMDYGGLHKLASSDKKASSKANKGQNLLVILNPIPGAARKAYSALLCQGDVQKVTLEPNLSFADLPEGADKRYVEATIDIDGQVFLVPKLNAVAVAFSYF